VSSPPIVKHFNVVKDIAVSLLAGRGLLSVRSFSFERAEERLGHGIVCTGPLIAHAALKAVALEQPLERGRSIRRKRGERRILLPDSDAEFQGDKEDGVDTLISR